jgi:oligopeptide/dipeptide ABC transporter ATP-binding protein
MAAGALTGIATSVPALLEIDHLTVRLLVDGRLRTALDDVSLHIGAGEAVGLVGESGSGKSMTARAVARLLPTGAATTGAIRFDGTDLLAVDDKKLRRLREQIGFVFQDPRAHINPVRRIGDFMTESLRTNRRVSRRAAEARAIELLARVGIADGARRLRQFPHELSGGLLQRVMIAAALLMEPKLILADEPTTALDVTTQADVISLLDELRRERGLALLFITHDLDLAGAMCDRTVVMYAGQVMEEQPSSMLHDRPRHPYTAALVGARPDVAATAPRLKAIKGNPLSAFEAPEGCAFASRCEHVLDECRAARPAEREAPQGRVRCIRADVAEMVAHG